MKQLSFPAAMGLLLAAAASFAGPITTVPWNGHTGAVSYTYDDARVSQLPNLLPQLDSLHIKATFEIAALPGLGNFTSRRADWIQVARNGHELANHTYNHENVNESNGDSVTKVIKAMADTLRGVDPSIQAVTFAYPNCNATTNATAKNGLSAENFMARGCATANYAWGTQPSDWMNIQGLIVSPTGVPGAVTLQNTAKTNNSWVITIVHDVVDPTPDPYSITPANNLIMLNAGITNKLWIDTYSTVGAYYRAHFTIDTAKAVTAGNVRTVHWVSPHPKMPKSVALRVKLDSTVFGDTLLITQGDTAIARQSDGSYIIDFMKLQLSVTHGVTALNPALRLRYATVRPHLEGRALVLGGLPAGAYTVSLRSVAGTLVQQGAVRTGGGYAALNLRAAPLPGIYQVSVGNSSGIVQRVPLLILK